MHALLIIKWLLFMLIMLVFIILALPLLIVASRTQPYGTEKWLDDMGQDHARRCALDFARLKED